jgi:hypothetical protein
VLPTQKRINQNDYSNYVGNDCLDNYGCNNNEN